MKSPDLCDRKPPSPPGTCVCICTDLEKLNEGKSQQTGSPGHPHRSQADVPPVSVSCCRHGAPGPEEGTSLLTAQQSSTSLVTVPCGGGGGVTQGARAEAAHGAGLASHQHTLSLGVKLRVVNKAAALRCGPGRER